MRGLLKRRYLQIALHGMLMQRVDPQKYSKLHLNIQVHFPVYKRGLDIKRLFLASPL